MELVNARLVRWYGTSVFVHDDTASGYATTWLGARSRLRTALQASGFNHPRDEHMVLALG